MNIITASTFEKTRNLIKSAKHPIILSSNDDELNRKILEKEKIDLLIINVKNRKDYQKQRNSGLDNVMVKEAAKKGIIIGINLEEYLNSNAKDKIEILARIRQNVSLCKKHKVKMTFIPQSRDLHGLKALGSVLGMPTNMLTFFN
jgi:RNase P/RNase MRP subunit p30